MDIDNQLETPTAAHTPPGTPNTRPHQRARVMETPIDLGLIGTRVMRTNPITIEDLLDENVEFKHNINRTHLKLQILRIITPKAGSNTATTKYQRGGMSQKISFVRIILCRNEDKLCYIMINHEHNKRLFHRDLLLRDNGVVTIGSFMRLLAPHPITQTMQDIPLICSDSPALILNTPLTYPEVLINNNIEGNKSGIAILNNATLNILRTQASQTKCTGKHCDRQRPHELLNQGCGCWGTSGIGITNLALLHTVVVESRNNARFMMRSFSSNRFNLDTFQDKSFPQTVPVTSLEHTEASDKLEDAIENCVQIINDNDGFTVVMWYSRGEINDKSLIGMNAANDEGQTDSGKINYHIIQILPTNREFLKRGNALSIALNESKFKVGENL